MKRLLTLLLSLMLILSSFTLVSANAEALSEDIVILYTNDAHTYIDGNLSYDVIAALKDELEKEYKHVILADAGDHIQGTAYGVMDNGETIVKLMNVSGYDVATLGNHEFDYGMEGCLNAIELAEYPYVACNFYKEKDGKRTENVLDSFVMFDCGKEKLAFVGILTPETYSSSTSKFFKNENDEQIYGIGGVTNPEDLYADIQKAIDDAKAAGATKVIGLGHLGVLPDQGEYTSTVAISKICGMDAFIDGHSHTIIEGDLVADKEGHDVLLTQTGNYLGRIGIMVIDSETGNIETDFIEFKEVLAADGKTVLSSELSSELYKGKEVVSDPETAEIKSDLITRVDTMLGEYVASSEVVFDNYDADGNRLIRKQETNSGDFSADALYYLFDNMDMDVDVAMISGGSIRNFAMTGDITYKSFKDMQPFGNIACMQKINGQQLLDALEWASRYIELGEDSSFLQVSGITYKIDTSIPNTVKAGDLDVWAAGPEKYRVYDVMVYNKETNVYEPLDLKASYNLAGYNYTLRDMGGGFAMLNGSENVIDDVMEDYMVLTNYAKGYNGEKIGATNSPILAKYPGFKLDYSTTAGSGRIEIVNGALEDAEVKEIVAGAMGNSANPSRAMFVDVLYKLEGEPKEEIPVSFEDIAADSAYADAVSWAKQNGIVAGVSETEFAPELDVTREQIAAILHRYSALKGKAPQGAWAIRLDYSDLNTIGDYAMSGVMYTKLKSIIAPKENNTFAPKDSVTGEETVTIIYNFANAIK